MPRVVAEEWPAADGRFWPARKLYAGIRRGRALISPARRRPAKPEAHAMRAAGRSLAGVWERERRKHTIQGGSRYVRGVCGVYAECLDAEAAGRGSAGRNFVDRASRLQSNRDNSVRSVEVQRSKL